MATAYQDTIPFVRAEDIQWDEAKHALMIRGRRIALTKTEYRLLFPLRHCLPITYADLSFIVYNCSVDEKVRAMMDKHIDRIRDKLRGTGIYIYCVLSYGYMLFSENWQGD